MVAKLGDRYTSFFDPQGYRELSNDIDGEISGVGVRMAIDYEISRQIALIENRQAFTQETRGWDGDMGETKPQRTRP